MPQISFQPATLLSSIEKLKGKAVLVVGDVGLDEYVLGDVRRISPEAPVPVLEVQSEDSRLGLSANVAQNIRGLGGRPVLVSVIGSDPTGEVLAALRRRGGVEPDFLVKDDSRPTTRKLRVMTGHHHIVRVDYEKKLFLKKEVEKQLLGRVHDVIDQIDAVVLQDYAKGVMSESVTQALIHLAHSKGKRVIVDPYRTTPLHYYRGADLMTPNHDESIALSGWVMDDLRTDADYVNKIGRLLMEKVQSENMVITLGAKGIRLFEGHEWTDLPTYARQVFDVTGAGDTVVAALAQAWAAGLSLREACTLANFAAGVVVGKVGCVPCPIDELKQYITQHLGSEGQLKA